MKFHYVLCEWRKVERESERETKWKIDKVHHKILSFHPSEILWLSDGVVKELGTGKISLVFIECDSKNTFLHCNLNMTRLIHLMLNLLKMFCYKFTVFLIDFKSLKYKLFFQYFSTTLSLLMFGLSRITMLINEISSIINTPYNMSNWLNCGQQCRFLQETFSKPIESVKLIYVSTWLSKDFIFRANWLTLEAFSCTFFFAVPFVAV